MILALETATSVCSVAYRDEEGAIFEHSIEKRGSHSEQLFLFVEKLLQKHNFSISELDAVLISEGPGSYTGLRISASAVKGLLFQTQVPLFGVNTLASFARRVQDKSPSAQTIHSIIDARRVHVYHQKFNIRDGQLETNDEIEVIPIEALEAMVRKKDTIIGTGLQRIDKNILAKAETYGPGEISATSMIRLYEEGLESFYHSVDPESFEPKYYTSNQVS